MSGGKDKIQIGLYIEKETHEYLQILKSFGIVISQWLVKAIESYKKEYKWQFDLLVKNEKWKKQTTSMGMNE